MKKVHLISYTMPFLNFTAIIISAFSCITFFNDNFNSNDFQLNGRPIVQINSENSFFINFVIANKSYKYIEDINAIIDVYDVNSKLISSGRTQHEKNITLKPMEGVRFTMEIEIDEDYKNIDYLVIIPFSKKGTGKLHTHLMPGAYKAK